MRLDVFVLLLTSFVLSEGQSDLDTIFLRLYVGSTADVYVQQSLREARELVAKMDGSKPTILYIHGFSESLESKSVDTVVQAYLNRKDHNVIGADYREIAGDIYPVVATRANDVGIAMADAINEMVKVGLDVEKLHIVGHSLGAQVAGHIGRTVAFQIPRITGLDPAGPFFNFLESHLTASDARFVDIIHTDYGIYGIAKTTGTVDFFPNGGRRIQPGCPLTLAFFSNDDFCSHHRSWIYYAESLSNEKSFLSVACPGHYQFIKGKCVDVNTIPMGIATPTNANGSYFLRTRGDSPYGRGGEGIAIRRKLTLV